MSYKLESAIGKYLIIEPLDRNNVLKASEVATVFKVVSAGYDCNLNFHPSAEVSEVKVEEGSLIIVEPQSVTPVMMGFDQLYFIRETDVIALVKNG